MEGSLEVAVTIHAQWNCAHDSSKGCQIADSCCRPTKAELTTWHVWLVTHCDGLSAQRHPNTSDLEI